MTVNYTLAENKGRASNGEVAYIGQLIHNEGKERQAQMIECRHGVFN